MKLERKETVTTKITECFCDICKEKSIYGSNCALCGIDICQKHTIFCDYNVCNGEYEHGDYPDKLCPNCYEVFKEMLPQYNKVNEDCSKQLDAIYQKLKERCKNDRSFNL